MTPHLNGTASCKDMQPITIAMQPITNHDRLPEADLQ